MIVKTMGLLHKARGCTTLEKNRWCVCERERGGVFVYMSVGEREREVGQRREGEGEGHPELELVQLSTLSAAFMVPFTPSGASERSYSSS